MGENETVIQARDDSSRVSITVENSPNASSVYIRLCKHRKKIFFSFYKIFFLEKEKNTLFYMALIKREILTSLEVLYTKLVRESVLFCKKDAFENTEFSHLKCQLKQKKLTRHVFKAFPSFIRRGNG